jgi:hypothetical protein
MEKYPNVTMILPGSLGLSHAVITELWGYATKYMLMHREYLLN